MGSVLTVISRVKDIIFNNRSGQPLSQMPVTYIRREDYTISGSLHSDVYEKWNNALHSMIFLDLNTRQTLWPIIQKRMDRIEASSKYTSCTLEELKKKFTGWDDRTIFTAHDVFQAFEMDGDGLIELTEMDLGLDNLGDKTPHLERLRTVRLFCEDESLDFEAFLSLMYRQVEENKGKTAMAQTFLQASQDVMLIRWMSTVQQIREGLL